MYIIIISPVHKLYMYCIIIIRIIHGFNLIYIHVFIVRYSFHIWTTKLYDPSHYITSCTCLSYIQALHIEQGNTKQTTITICCLKYIVMGVDIEIALYVYMCCTYHMFYLAV